MSIGHKSAFHSCRKPLCGEHVFSNRLFAIVSLWYARSLSEYRATPCLKLNALTLRPDNWKRGIVNDLKFTLRLTLAVTLIYSIAYEQLFSCPTITLFLTEMRRFYYLDYPPFPPFTDRCYSYSYRVLRIF